MFVLIIHTYKSVYIVFQSAAWTSKSTYPVSVRYQVPSFAFGYCILHGDLRLTEILRDDSWS